MAEMLLKKGADINAQNIYGQTHLCIAAERLGYNNSTEIREYMAFLMEKGADPNKGSDEYCPLLIAAENHETEVLLLLLKHGANPTRVNLDELWEDSTAKDILKAACIVWKKEHWPLPQIVKFLSTLGALIGIKNVGKNTRGKNSIPPSPVRGRF